MSVFRLGSRGDEVRRIQQRLHTLGIYRGALDGVFGGATAAAVRNFQNSAGVASDGVVGPVTWKALFADDIPSPAIASMPLDYRCLALTGAFETGAAIPDCFSGLTGDCDGQGISLGVLQWNFGQGSLQPLLRRMVTDHGERCRAVFHEHCDLLAAVLAASKSQQMAFARSIQDLNRKTVNEPWRGMFRSLGRTAEFQRIQLDAAHSLYRAALKVSSEYGLWSERAVALMFDIQVQNGGIGDAVQERIRADFRALPPTLSDEGVEEERLRIVANRRAEAARTRYAEDVRARKLCIANGGGTVHGITYDLDGQFGVGLRRYS